MALSTVPVNARFRFNGFTFDPETGELVHQDDEGTRHVSRLAPQPAKLLTLLLGKYPGIVTHAEIQQAIWPDVRVDFERSLHFCIRQIRSALSDQAADPVFIETIARRGYRWKVAYELIEGTAAGRVQGRLIGKSRFPMNAPFNTRRHFTLAVAVLATLLLVALVITGNNRDGENEAGEVAQLPLRLAVMPFQPADSTHAMKQNDIALRLVNDLTNAALPYEIIGPSTTSDFDGGQLRKLIDSYDITYVINGKFSIVQDTSRLLAEIIRGTDGAHVWVRYFDSSTSYDTVVARIIEGMRSVRAMDY